MAGTSEAQERYTAVVVDDSRTIRSFLKLALKGANIEVVGEGASGEEIAALYERHRPTLLFADIVLPNMDGVEACTQLLQKNPEAMVIICSSLTSRDRAIAAQKAGVKRYLLKPCTQEKVVEVAREVLELRQKRQSDSSTARVA